MQILRLSKLFRAGVENPPPLWRIFPGSGVSS